MAKSIRSKAKMASRARKRQQSHYAVAEAQRTQRLSDKLLGKTDKSGEEIKEEDKEEAIEDDAEMKEEPKKISTSGLKGNRREQWRSARGLAPRPKAKLGAKKNSRRR
ncbi:hypothetical protein B9479_001184 [Cryptococcus floricola]|uniref:DUF2423 domain-containing protein n=1 Tax=Cryptococcus floricola TaxID=2591691 RepID=A0A5D3B529_9TREE|nr:hypothetical protein B9479_001184 [Cryptococcus floricola]